METEQTLGTKTLRFLLLRNSIGGLLLLVISIALFIGSGSLERLLPFNAAGVSADTSAAIIHTLTSIFLFASLAVLLIIAAVTWVSYANTTFLLNEYALAIRKGFMNKREILIPYRQIQDVDLNRTLFHRMLGVSNLVILTAGNDDKSPTEESARKTEESEGVFNLLDADLAEKLQAELMKRASVQMVSEVGPHPGAPLPV
jgi:uncharacterized membrane protein YdbT with pleckstrin-like domain